MTQTAKKKSKNIIIMAVMVAVLLVAVIILRITGSEEDVTTEDFSYPITSLTSAQIASVEYDYKDGSHAYITNVDGTWYNGDDMDFPLSSDGFESQFIEEFVEITATKKVTDYEGGLDALGLSEPELTITVTGKNLVTTTYKMGDYNPTMDLYYMMINDDEENIYMVSSDLVYICREDIYDFASIDTFPGFSTDTLNYLEFKSGSSTTKLYYKEDGAEEDITGYEWNWFFGEPFSRLMPCESSKMESLQEDVFDTLAYSKTVNYKATEEELAEYGLDNPIGSYTIYAYVKDDDGNITDTASITVYIGNLNSDEGGYYTREITTVGLSQTVSNVVRILDTSSADTLMAMNPLDYILQNVLFLSINDIDGSYITFNNGTTDYTFWFDGGDDKSSTDDDVYKQDDTVIDDEEFRDLWYQMTCIAPERILTEKTSTEDLDAVYTIYSARNADDYYGNITVRFIKYDATYYQVEINGITDVLMRKKEVDDFFSALTEFAEGNM